MIGYDFDGVINMGGYFGGYKPSVNDVIITGNTLIMVPQVLRWLYSHGIECAVYFMPYKNGANNRELTGMWKSEMILKLGCNKFYEDDPLQYQIIKSCCPDCEVIKVC